MTKVFPSFFDTKVLAAEAGKNGKTDLEGLYKGSCNDKKLLNNLMFSFCKSESEFLNYEVNKQSHDAGYDAYMTGVVFATLSKFLEIALIVQPLQEKAPVPEQ